MKYKWLEEYCLSKKGAIKEYKTEWEAFLYKVGGKMFVMAGEDGGKKPIVSLKCEPMTGQLLRSQYPDIVPGYYMNKEHWNSVYLEGAVPVEVLKRMIDMSYDLVLNSLTKKMIRQIQEA